MMAKYERKAFNFDEIKRWWDDFIAFFGGLRFHWRCIHAQVSCQPMSRPAPKQAIPMPITMIIVPHFPMSYLSLMLLSAVTPSKRLSKM
jgi:hypothetical protein